MIANASASVWDIGDGVLCFEFTSKSNSLDEAIMALLGKTIALVKKDNPDAASGEVVTALNAAYCPVVANRTDLTRAQQRSALIAFSDLAGQQYARTSPADVSKVLVNTPLSPDAVAQIDQAAAAAGLSPSAFIAKQLSAGGTAPSSSNSRWGACRPGRGPGPAGA